MEEHIRKQRVRADDARFHSRENRRYRRGVFRGIEFALVLNGLLDALVLFHSNSLDPGHLLRLRDRRFKRIIVTRPRPLLPPRTLPWFRPWFRPALLCELQPPSSAYPRSAPRKRARESLAAHCYHPDDSAGKPR